MEGYCKNCNRQDLEWRDRLDVDNSVGYQFTCKNCGHEGTEWYSLVYSETVMCCEEPI